jgi:hypothetical protein
MVILTDSYPDRTTSGGQEWRAVNEGTMPRALWDNMLVKERIEFDWLECACCSVPYAAGVCVYVCVCVCEYVCMCVCGWVGGCLCV